MEKCNNICNLTDDYLINILKHCDIQSLGRLARTCKRLNNIVENEESVWLPKSQKVLGSNLNSPFMVQRSKPVLTPIQRCKVSRNWTSGFHDKTYVMRYMRCLPWMCMEKDYLFVSKGKRIVKLFRNNDGNIEQFRINSSTFHEDDISKFVISGDNVFSVGWDRQICRYRKSDLECTAAQLIHNGEILAIDSKNDLLVTGSRDETIKIWKPHPSNQPVIKVGEFSTDVRVLSLSLLPSTELLVAGLPGTKGVHPLPIFNIEHETILTYLGEDFLNGGGIIDIYPESDNIILTCGYDTTLKLWDVRTPRKCVSHWVEPYDNILYSVKSDHSFTLVAGCNRSGFFHTWDKRSREVIQTHHNAEFGSPVYCLTFDASHVYSALNRAVVQHCFMPSSEVYLDLIAL